MNNTILRWRSQNRPLVQREREAELGQDQLRIELSTALSGIAFTIASTRQRSWMIGAIATEVLACGIHLLERHWEQNGDGHFRVFEMQLHNALETHRVPGDRSYDTFPRKWLLIERIALQTEAQCDEILTWESTRHSSTMREWSQAALLTCWLGFALWFSPRDVKVRLALYAPMVALWLEKGSSKSLSQAQARRELAAVKAGRLREWIAAHPDERPRLEQKWRSVLVQGRVPPHQ